MAVDKLVDSAQLDADLTSVANAIRTKGGTSAQLAFPAGFVSAVEAIPTGGGTPENISVTIENAADSGGTIAISNAENVNIYGIAPQNPNSKNIAKGASLARICLLQDGCIVLSVNSVKLVSATYNGVSLPITANSWYARIELPSNFDNTIPIVVKR